MHGLPTNAFGVGVLRKTGTIRVKTHPLNPPTPHRYAIRIFDLRFAGGGKKTDQRSSASGMIEAVVGRGLAVKTMIVYTLFEVIVYTFYRSNRFPSILGSPWIK